jgi:ribonucleoside-diphosphate reductase alpha chain
MNGHSTNGKNGTPAANGLHANGHSTNGYQGNGRSSNGHTSNGHTANGHAANGAGSNGHSSNGQLLANPPASLAQRMTNSLEALRPTSVAMEAPASRNQQFAKFQSDAPSCSQCGAITVRNGNCYLCHNCGTSHGCS